MKWERKVPEAKKDTPAVESAEAFCASSDRGEYSVEHGVNDKFAVHLDGLALTGFTFRSAVEAMQHAGGYDEDLTGLL